MGSLLISVNVHARTLVGVRAGGGVAAAEQAAEHPFLLLMAAGGGSNDGLISESRCAAEQCGCRGTRTLIITYHKTGTVLCRRLQEELEAACAMPRTAWPGPSVDWEYGMEPYAMMALNSTCSTRRLCLDQFLSMPSAEGAVPYVHNPTYTAKDFTGRQNSTFLLWLRRYLRPTPGRPLVHMVREPFALVVSYYLHHRAGHENNRNPAFRRAWEAISRTTPEKGVLHIARLALNGQLQLMVHNHRELSGRPDVLTMRLDATDPYDDRMRQFANWTGVAQRCSASGSSLQRKFARHDVSRWSTEQRLADVHVNDDAQAVNQPWRNRTVLLRTLQSTPWADSRLRLIGRRLGYEY